VPSWLLDWGPVVFVGLVGVGAVVRHPGAGADPRLAAAVAIVATALMIRHRAPLATLAITLVVAVSINYSPVTVLPILFGVFTVAEYKDRRRVLAAALLAAAVLTFTPAIHGTPLGKLAPLVGHIIPVGLAVAIGLYVRARADYVGGLRERAERLDRERELLAEQAVADERVQIARELHDVVAHNVSLMVVQAQALAATGADEDQQASLGRVADLGREALSEMHRMLGVLRLQRDFVLERAPQPGVRDLETLVRRTRETGVDASLLVVGRASELPQGVETSLYRIVQEALTNVVRHANAHHATVTLLFTPESVEVSIVDDGVGPGPSSNGNGSSRRHGLVGMRERVALFGGELDTGPDENGTGYRVHAYLPRG
jgi:signal transduction histidine kinase